MKPRLRRTLKHVNDPKPTSKSTKDWWKLGKGELISTNCIVIGLACRKADEADCGQRLSQ